MEQFWLPVCSNRRHRATNSGDLQPNDTDTLPQTLSMCYVLSQLHEVSLRYIVRRHNVDANIGKQQLSLTADKDSDGWVTIYNIYEWCKYVHPSLVVGQKVIKLGLYGCYSNSQ